jgi:RNA polymerase sigma-70 factor (ECF subfamily)
VELTDEQLFERYRGGDMSAFRQLMERHHGDLLRFLYRLTGDAASADDVFQETFLQIHQSSDTFDITRRFRPWLFTIAANKARDYVRRRGRRRTLDLSAPVAGGGEEGGVSFVDLMEVNVPQPDQGLETEETQSRVQAALDALPGPLREILLLAYFQRLSYAQIADELEIPLGTVKSRLHAAVAAFGRRWQKDNAPGGQEGSPER